MTPTPYSDLGKRARDLFSKGYHFGLIKLDCRTTTASGVNFHSGGQSEQESGKVSGSFESKYTVKDYGISFTEKWTTDNTLGTEVTVTDQGLKGLKVTAGVNFSPQEGVKSGVTKVAYANEKFAANADADLKGDSQMVKASAVVGHQGWLTGYQGTFDVQNTKLAKSNFSLGFSTKDFVLHTEVYKEAPPDEGEEGGEEEGGEEGPGQVFVGSVYQNITSKLAMGVDMSWPQCGDKNFFAIGTVFDLDPDATIRAKIDNAAQIGLSYTQRLRDGITITMSANVDGNNMFGPGNHKLGLSVEFEANDGQLFSGAIYQQVNPKLETGVNLSWATSGEKTVFGLACKYNLDQDASLRAKINNSSQIGLGYQQRLREGVTLTLSTLVDGRNFNQGGHKIGLALELEA